MPVSVSSRTEIMPDHDSSIFLATRFIRLPNWRIIQYDGGPTSSDRSVSFHDSQSAIATEPISLAGSASVLPNSVM
jgi:hypothetical protein